MTETGNERPDDARQLAIARLKVKQEFKGMVAAGAFAIVVTIAIWALSGGGYFWPLWVVVGVAAGAISLGWKAYGPANQITEDDVQREMRKGG